MLQNMVKTVGDTPINKMTAAQLESVYNTLRAMTHVIQTGIKVKLVGEERNAWEVAHDMTRETRSVNKPKKSLMSGWVNVQLSAERMFHRLGNQGHKQFNTGHDDLVDVPNQGVHNSGDDLRDRLNDSRNDLRQGLNQ